ncbi:MAG: hypothetical protein EBU07_10180 [Betaproteobacteria bacterium]|jgi:hypothetical protein|nr:hypothetical protein [Betaproteobacteria bacterium]NBS47014.1 hypothetical protein [Betaproteobacteria bacterium]
MNDAQQIATLRELRAQLARLIAATPEPQIEAILRSADMELHWALWNLGEVVEHRPEIGRQLLENHG